MAINRFSLYQMEQFKKDRNKKLMESATKSVEECGFSSKQIKKMMKKKGKEKEEDEEKKGETKECGCGPMKKGKKLSKSEKAPGMRPEPKDKAVVHNMESDVIREARAKKSRKNGLQTKDVMRLKKEQKRMLKLRGNTKDKVAESDGNGILKATKLFMGVTKKGKGKKGMFDMKGNNKAIKKNNKMHKMSESGLEESKKTRQQILDQQDRVHDRLLAKANKKEKINTRTNKGLSRFVAIADKAERAGANSMANRNLLRQEYGVNTGARGARNSAGKVIKGQKNYKAKESDTPVKATKVVISESRKSSADIEHQYRGLLQRAKGDPARQKKIFSAAYNAKVNRGFVKGGSSNSGIQDSGRKRPKQKLAHVRSGGGVAAPKGQKDYKQRVTKDNPALKGKFPLKLGGKVRK